MDILDTANSHHVPITGPDGELIGILSDRDLRSAKMIIDFLAQDGDSQLGTTKVQVHEVMTQNPLTVNKELTVQEAASLMVANKINVLPVVDGNRLEGLVTSTDLLALLTNG